MKDLPILLIEVGMPSDAIDSLLHTANQQVLAKKIGFYIVVNGYDDDPRDLWEIPEAMELLDEFASRGAMAVLEPNIPLESRFDPRLIGSFQLWCLWKRKGTEVEFTRELFGEYLESLSESNQKISGDLN